MTNLKLDVIGDPIGHSKSPLIHETVLESIGIPHEYRKVRVEKGSLKAYIDEVKMLGISGFNLTIPHKTDIIPYLDYIDDEARIFNSVNTVKVENGKLWGYNTDGRGFLRAMEGKGFFADKKNVVLIGAGGVASCIALKMILEGASSLTIINRSKAPAEAISENVFKHTGKKIRVLPFSKESFCLAACDCDILINSTPLGMQGTEKDFEDLTFLEGLKPSALVYDLIYNPSETKLLSTAKSLGINALNGLGMLIYQGLLADEIFLGRSLDFEYLGAKIESKFKKLNFF